MSCGGDPSPRGRAPTPTEPTAPTTSSPTIPSTVETGDGLETYTYDGPLGPEGTFAHGVASGDPLPDAVVLWTRVTAGHLGLAGVDVFLEVARDVAITDRIAAEWLRTDASSDYTVHVDARGLPSGSTVYYRFSALGRTSPVGRTRTAPSGAVDRLRFGVCACASYGWGWFHVYRHLAARADLDAVIHLGDYLYEHAMAGHGKTYGEARPLDPPHEALTLDDYRRRYAWYRLDPDLQEVHRQHPFVHLWDDHEFANDPRIGGAANHDADTEGEWDDRVAAALQAWMEWIPARLGAGGELYRTLVYGDLARIVCLDRQRQYLFPADEDAGEYLGAAQAAWLDGEIAATTEPWLLLAQQTRFTTRAPEGVEELSWDTVSRARVLDASSALPGTDLVILAGDIHRMEACDVVRAPGAVTEGVEIVCGSVTSPGVEDSTTGVDHFHWSYADDKGYVVVDVTRDRLVADWFGYPDVLKLGPILPAESFLAGFVTDHGGRQLVETSAPEPPKVDPPPLA